MSANYSARDALTQALTDIFCERYKFIDVVNACCAAQRLLAAEHKDLVTVQGWIVGKRADPNT